MVLVGSLTAPGVDATRTQQRASQRATQAADAPRDPDERAAGGERLDNNDPEGTVLLLTPSHLQVARGAPVRLTLSVLGADDLRRLPVTIRFDPGVLEPVDVRLGAAWGGGPPPLLLFDSHRPGEVVIGLALIDRQRAGVSGSAELLELEFRAVGPGHAALRIERFAALSAGGRARPAAAAATEIVVR